jgi:hypothetical protein
MQHTSDESRSKHPDWRTSAGVALPTVADIHHAHYFKIRAITRLAAPTEPLWIVPQTEETSQAEEKSEAKAA